MLKWLQPASLAGFVEPLMIRAALSLLAGLLMPLGFAPYNLWPVIWISVLMFFWVLMLSRHNRYPQLLLLGWLYGLGLFGFGISWVYYSMQVAQTPLILSLIMTGLFCSAVALLMGGFAVTWHALQKRIASQHLWLLFTLLWLLFEWLRSWIFTGLPWLLVGTGFTDHWLAGWLPVIGSYGVSALVVASAALLLSSWLQEKKTLAVISVGYLVLILGLGWVLKPVDWVSPDGEPIEAVALQGNIDQRNKWLRSRIIPTFELYRDFTLLYSDADLVVWPEAAITEIRSQAGDLIRALEVVSETTDTALVVGILSDEINERGEFQYWNSLLGISPVAGVYHKTQMVPFGEYVPFPDLLRGLIDFFDLPMSTLVPGPSDGSVLKWQKTDMAPLICYEIAYPALVRKLARQAGIIVTVSNDAWFGDSIGPHQHLQIARARAIETGRPLVRATQDGLSAILDNKGKVLAVAPKFRQTGILAEIQPVQGDTPYLKLGHVWQVILSIVVIGLLVFKARRHA